MTLRVVDTSGAFVQAGGGGAGAAGTNTIGMSNLGNTSGTTGVVTGTGVQALFAGGNNVTLSQSINGVSATITISAADQTVESQSIGMSNIGNTSGTTGIVSGGQVRFLFAGGNNITLSQSINGVSGTITISAANETQTVPPIATTGKSVLTANSVGTVTRFAAEDHGHEGVFAAGVSTGGNTAGNTTVQPGRVVFAGGNNITLSVGTAAGALQTITISAANETQTVPPIATAVKAVGSAKSTGTITRFAPEDHQHDGVAQFQISGNTSNTSNSVVGSLVLAGGNNITLSQVSAAGAATVTISAAAQTNQQMTFFATSNTTQSSTGTTNASSVIFAGAGIASVGITNGSVVISVPAGGGAGDGGNTLAAGTRTAGSNSVVLFSNANNVTFGLDLVNGSIMTASVPNIGTMSRWINAADGIIGAAGTIQGNSLVSVQPIFIPHYLGFSNIHFGGSINIATTTLNSTAYFDVSATIVLYTRNVSTLSSINSGSSTYSQSWSSNATGSVTGAVGFSLSLASSTLLTPGEYWAAVHVSTTNTGTGANSTVLGRSLSMAVVPGGASGLMNAEPFGVGAGSTRGIFPGLGIISTGATRDSIAFSDIVQSGTRAALAPVILDLRNYTIW